MLKHYVIISVNGAQTVILDWKNPSSISLLPTAPSGYKESPSFSSRLMINPSGHLISNGQLQSTDAGTYMITTPDFTGSVSLTLRISGELIMKLFHELKVFIFTQLALLCLVGNSQTVTLDWKDPSSISLLPTAPSGYQVSPSSLRLMVNSSGHLVSNGQLNSSDAGTYTIASPDFAGTLRIMIRISGMLVCI